MIRVQILRCRHRGPTCVASRPSQAEDYSVHWAWILSDDYVGVTHYRQPTAHLRLRAREVPAYQI